MRGATQLEYSHRLPRRGREACGLRVNATFRRVVAPRGATDEQPVSEKEEAGETGEKILKEENAREDVEDDDDDDDEDDGVDELAGVRFAARRLGPRLFVGHGEPPPAFFPAPTHCALLR